MIIELTTYSKRAWYKMLSFAKIYGISHRNIQLVENKEILCIEILMNKNDYCFKVFKHLFDGKFKVSNGNPIGRYITLPYNYDVELQKNIQQEVKNDINGILNAKYI